MSDPAFLFYSKDFFEGTRMMLPEERACYIDLMIYQHQNGFIPNDIKRLALYCSGVSEDAIKATLEAKFKLCEQGWINEKLNKVMEERAEFSSKQSINGTVGQFFKKAKQILNAATFSKLRTLTAGMSNLDIFNYIKDKETNEAMLQAMLIALHKHLEDEDAIINKDSLFSNITCLSFDEFWNLYDKKVGDKDKLQKKWKTVSESDRMLIKDHIPKYKAAQPDKKFRKDPQTYLNNKSWNDEIITSTAKPNNEPEQKQTRVTFNV